MNIIISVITGIFCTDVLIPLTLKILMWPQVKTRLVTNSTKTALGMQTVPDDYMTRIHVCVDIILIFSDKSQSPS